MPDLVDVLVWTGGGCVALLAAAPVLRHRTSKRVQSAIDEALRTAPQEPRDR